MTRDDPLAHVLGSSVRSAVLEQVAGGTTDTEAILAALDASSSAVYNAFGALEEEGLLRDGDAGWELTGRGAVVATFLDARADVEAVLVDTAPYWQHHRVTDLPPRFQLRLGELAGAEHRRASETQPQRVVGEIADCIASGDRIEVISPIFVPEYADALPDRPDTRLIVTPSIAATETDGPDLEHVDARVANVNFALGVTDSVLLLSLPTLDGQYDARSEIVAESAAAREWGRDLFRWQWERAAPVPGDP